MNSNNKNNLKIFFIKLVSITFSIIIVVNITYNIFFAEKFDNINQLMELNKKENIDVMKDKIRLEIKKGLNKENIFNKGDAKLLKDFYNKIRQEINKAE
jgi:hypothetical protein